MDNQVMYHGLAASEVWNRRLTLSRLYSTKLQTQLLFSPGPPYIAVPCGSIVKGAALHLATRVLASWQGSLPS